MGVSVPVTLGVNGPIIGTGEVTDNEVVIYMKPDNLAKEIEQLLTIDQIRGFSVELTYRDIELGERRVMARGSRHIHPASRPAETFDENTLFKVYDSLRASGLDAQKARDAISDMQNKGILFRERAPEVNHPGPTYRNQGDF